MRDDADLVTLMRRVQAGDMEAYAELLHDLIPRLRGLVHRQRAHVGSGEANDLVQDILLSLHRARATYDPTRPFLPWLRAIARNRLADAARRHARRSAHEVLVDEDDVTFRLQRPNRFSETFPDSGLVKQAVRALPRGQRMAIELLKLQEMSLREAARTTGTSMGALKVATHRAMNALRKMLKA